MGDRMVNELKAVVNELGGERTLGLRLSSDRDLREAIREGFRPAVVEELMHASGLTLKELANALDLSPRSLQRRRSSGRLARYESDRLYRLARIVAIANEYLGGRDLPYAGLSVPIVPWAVWHRSRPSIRSSALGRLKTFSDVLPTAESVEPSLSGLA
jgi:putative toxin-antitoxin system antitoxin component (TIGR02293 family)